MRVDSGVDGPYDGIMPPLALPSIEDHLERVVDETNKAACYLVAAMAPRFVPRLHERLEESPTQLAFLFLRQGAHMAFLSTLAALVEETTDPRIVNLPKLLGRFNDQAVRRAIADRRQRDPAAVYSRARALQTRFTDYIAPLTPQVNDLRNNVVAHHGIITNWPASTYGGLTLVMIRVVALVDAVSELVTGIETNVRMNMSTVRFQAASLWSRGIDGDLEVGPGPPPRQPRRRDASAIGPAVQVFGVRVARRVVVAVRKARRGRRLGRGVGSGFLKG
jgi:hypothetical protein